MRNITFITGPAGTGKSTRLRQLIKEESRPSLICAPTGVASVNVGGSTIHRTFKINVDSGYVGKKWSDVEIVYIDEASMMGMKLFEQALAGAPNADFVLVGDMAQLPPVKDKYWFMSPYLKTYNLNIQHLTKQWRQENDVDFSEVLNSIRDGSISRDDLRWMYTNSLPQDENEIATILAYRNDTVRATNAERMLELPGKMYEFSAAYSGIMKPGDCIAETDLYVKVGAEVIMLNNDPEGRWSNGTRGKVMSFFEDTVTIMIGSKSYDVTQHQWKSRVPQEVTPQRRVELEEYVHDFKNIKDCTDQEQALLTGIEYVVAGSCKQYPFKLAYAMTVHKAQGMTLDAAHIITSGFAGCYGIGYVAVSRVRSVDTISFDRKPVPNDFKFDNRLTNFI